MRPLRTPVRLLLFGLVVSSTFAVVLERSQVAAQFEPPSQCQLAPATGRYFCEPFLSYWTSNSGLQFFGLPLTGPFDTTSPDTRQRVTVQYFERQRLEFHPSSATSSGELMLGRLGVEVLTGHGRDWHVFPDADPGTEDYFAETGHAIDPLFRDYWMSHGLNLGDPGISFRESLALIGYPISELMIETNSSLDQVVVQWYERARLEFHPSSPPGQRVQLGRLGAELNVLEPAPTVDLELVAEGLTSPVALVPAVDGSSKMFVVDQVGLVRIITPDGGLLGSPFLDLRDRMVPVSASYDERGLLGFAFHPSFAINGLVYVLYSAPLRSGAPDGWNHTAHLSEFRVSVDNPEVIDSASERILLEIDEPHWAHNGGAMAFGPDGYLYVGLGDGGHGGDEGLGHVEDWYAQNRGGNGQDIEDNLLGSILRLDVNSETGYGIPEDNPFVGRAGLDEIWAYGFRNPFRFSFDSFGTRELFVGDVGQDLWEEIDIARPGANYGWNVWEGSHCYYNAEPPHSACPTMDPDGNPLTPPIIEFSNSGAPDGGLGRAIIGGFIYRGQRDLALYGSYVFGAWSEAWNTPSGKLLVAHRPPGGNGLWDFRSLNVAGTSSGTLDHYLLGFGQDNAGELYILTTDVLGPTGTTGRIYRLTD